MEFRKIEFDISDWKIYGDFWITTPIQLKNALGSNIDDYFDLLAFFRDSQRQLREKPIHFRTIAAVVGAHMIRARIESRLSKCEAESKTMLSGILRPFLEGILGKVTNQLGKLEQTNVSLLDGIQIALHHLELQTLQEAALDYRKLIAKAMYYEKTLIDSRFPLASNWVYSETVAAASESLSTFLTRRLKDIEKIHGVNYERVEKESKELSNEIIDFTHKWQNEKPENASIPHKLALQTLKSFEEKLFMYKSQIQDAATARQFLDLKAYQFPNLTPFENSVKELLDLWSEIGDIHCTLDQFREVPWITSDFKPIRDSLNHSLQRLESMSPSARQYRVHGDSTHQFRLFLDSCNLVQDLKNSPLRERHWRTIQSVLGLPGLDISIATLGHLWDAKISRFEQKLREIISIAEGEFALEKYIQDVGQFWDQYRLVLIPYKARSKIIRNPEIFEKCRDYSSGFASMKCSPYVGNFANNVEELEKMLRNISAIYESVFEMQKEWSYLGGIFLENPEVKRSLSLETSRFQALDREICNFMRELEKFELVKDVMQVPGLREWLARTNEALCLLKNSLHDYLEIQRANCPRFYFVGDEDLFEILGSGTSISALKPHFCKLFGALVDVVVPEDESIVLGCKGYEGETWKLQTPINLLETPSPGKFITGLEEQIRISLANFLAQLVQILAIHSSSFSMILDSLIMHLNNFPFQIVILSLQISLTSFIEKSINTGKIESFEALSADLSNFISYLSSASSSRDPLSGRKRENLLIITIFYRDLIQTLSSRDIHDSRACFWNSCMRLYYSDEAEPLSRVNLEMGSASFIYGFEYVGVPEQLVRTNLTESCFLTLTHALSIGMGGSPFGPAGTGKTESVKSLGSMMGRQVVVFCCDERFDLSSLGRIITGLCRIGAWGCFDEFNRLTDNILSAVCQLLSCVQDALRCHQTFLKFLGRTISLDRRTAIFITMNPSYAGRRELPNNLKKLFRNVAMIRPDHKKIIEICLYSQGFQNAEDMANRLITLFDMCNSFFTTQRHYDFGLRTIKSVLRIAHRLKFADYYKDEREIIFDAIMHSVAPKLTPSDYSILLCSMQFTLDKKPPNRDADMDFKKVLKTFLFEDNLVPSDSWIQKAVELHNLLCAHHGVILVGPSGCGKTSLWSTVLKTICTIIDSKSNFTIIDGKLLSTNTLFGHWDSVTNEWFDGIIPGLFRTLSQSENLRNYSHWIIFDGDIDPDWIENLNSVLDDNRILTLPNGERLALPDNVRLVFETTTLNNATLATISRCGVFWLNDTIVDPEMIFKSLSRKFLSQIAESCSGTKGTFLIKMVNELIEEIERKTIANALANPDIKLSRCMQLSPCRFFSSLFAHFLDKVRSILHHDKFLDGLPEYAHVLYEYLRRSFIWSCAWTLAGDCDLTGKRETHAYLTRIFPEILEWTLNNKEVTIFDIDFKPSLDLEIEYWSDQTGSAEAFGIDLLNQGLLVPTPETVCHAEIIRSCIRSKRSIFLCGPAGSGKTMILNSAIKSIPSLVLVSINLTSNTTIQTFLSVLEHHCIYVKEATGFVLRPKNLELALFLDEVNLPKPDAYGTPLFSYFLRSILEKRGFIHPTSMKWIELQRIYLMAACNPPTDLGRIELPERLLRHLTLIYIDYPSPHSLIQIYAAMLKPLFRPVPSIRPFHFAFSEAMIEVYEESSTHFRGSEYPHYLFSPRELTRWVLGMRELLMNNDLLSLQDAVLMWSHEAFRVFSDRLVTQSDKAKFEELVFRIACFHFEGISRPEMGKRILFSNWLSKTYKLESFHELRKFLQSRIKVFQEEELNVNIIVFPGWVDHALRLNRVFNVDHAHMVLAGTPSSGRSTLVKFVAWMNGYIIIQLLIHRGLTLSMFEETLRSIFRRIITKKEKICLVLDESAITNADFLEGINNLLANGDISSFFKDEELSQLLESHRSPITKSVSKDLEDLEGIAWLRKQMGRNFHVIFTVDSNVLKLKEQILASPALLNRCLINWMGEWTDETYKEICTETYSRLDLNGMADLVPSHLVEVLTDITLLVLREITALFASLSSSLFTNFRFYPSALMDFLHIFANTLNSARSALEAEQLHLNLGLSKLNDAFKNTEEMRMQLRLRKHDLESKETRANEKLKEIVSSQQLAEHDRLETLKLHEQIATQQHVARLRENEVRQELGKIEPVVEEAARSVTEIKKQHLVELRSMANPPETVKTSMEIVCALLGEDVNGWKSVQSILRRDDFIPSIINFETANLEPQLSKKLEAVLAKDPNLNLENVYRASRACGPLIMWVRAQIDYATVLERIKPLRSEISYIEVHLHELEAKLKTIETSMLKLESNIERLKSEYADLIREVEGIKSEIFSIECRNARAEALLSNLQFEVGRWKTQVGNFPHRMKNILGDSLLKAMMDAFFGPLDLSCRKRTMEFLENVLRQSGISFSESADILSHDFDSILDELGDFADIDMARLNLSILVHTQRTPMIMDPAGNGSALLERVLYPRKIVKISSLDHKFLRTLETSVRFGNALVVEDADFLDPVLFPILARDFRNIGGRNLVSLAGQDIEVSAKFQVFLCSRTLNFRFSESILSRLVILSFFGTRASMQSQCLHVLLKTDRPDIEEKRASSLKTRQHIRSRLSQLEHELLSQLSADKNGLLENDELLNSLEHIQIESNELVRKSQDVTTIISDLDLLSRSYEIAADKISRLHDVLNVLKELDGRYVISGPRVLSIVFSAIRSFMPGTIVTEGAVEQHVVGRVFSWVRRDVSRCLLQKHHLTFDILLLLAFIGLNLESIGFSQLNEIRKIARRCRKNEAIDIGKLQEEISKKLFASANLPNRPDDLDIPLEVKKHDLEKICQLFQTLILNPQDVTGLIQNYIRVFSMAEQGPNDISMIDLILNECDWKIPFMMRHAPGYDCTVLLKDVASQRGLSLIVVDLGSKEAELQAEELLKIAERDGTWIMLENIHLAIDWISLTIRRLATSSASKSFRLLLTTGISNELPNDLLYSCRCLMIENLPDLAETLKYFLLQIKDLDFLHNASPEGRKIYFSIVFLHCILLGRLSYLPVGWTLHYEFTETDLVCALRFAHHVLSRVSCDEAIKNSTEYVYQRISGFLNDVIYGSKLMNQIDRAILQSLTAEVVDLKFLQSYEQDGNSGYISATCSLLRGFEFRDLFEWSETLRSDSSLMFLGLSPTINDRALLSKGETLLGAQIISYLIAVIGEASLSQLLELHRKHQSLIARTEPIAHKEAQIRKLIDWKRKLEASIPFFVVLMGNLRHHNLIF